VEEVGRDDHFSELGGDSLLAANVLDSIQSETGVNIGFSAAFDAFTVAALAVAVDERRSGNNCTPARRFATACGSFQSTAATIYEEDDWVFRLLEREDVEAATECLANAFARSPSPLALGLEPAELAPYVKFYCEKAATEKLGLLAIERRSSRLVACGLCSDYYDICSEYYDNADASQKWSSKLATHVALERSLNRTFAAPPPRPGLLLFMNFVGVVKAYESRQLIPRIVELTLDQASAHGYESVIGEIMAEPLQRLLLSHYEFNKLGRILYEDFEYEGRRPYAGRTAPDAGALLLTRHLSSWRRG
jgi:hypothetical protein